MRAETLPALIRLPDMLDAWDAEADELHAAKSANVIRGPALAGLPTLAAEMGGVLPRGLHVLHGEPGTGKTALALQIAGTCGTPALYVSCEMAALELFRRVVARTTSTYLGRLRTGELDPERMRQLARRAVEATPHLAIADATLAPADIAWLTDAASAVRDGTGPLLVVVDSIHSWAEGLSQEAEYEALGAAIQALRRLVADLDCTVLGVAERNRAAMRQGGISASAGSRKFEYSAETVLDLAASDDPPDIHGETIVTLSLAKNRHGSRGAKIPLRFSGALQAFREDA